MIYFDYASTTPIDPVVIKHLSSYFANFANTSSLHQFGQKAKKILEKNRKDVANFIKADPPEIVFTSSATESNNTALKGIAFANKNKGNHIIISSIEHDCILNSANWLKTQGFKITKIPVDKFGWINPNDVKKAITKNTILVSIMHANNEIGTIEPITEIGKICHKHNIYFHTDASQTFGKIPINVRKMNIDLLTASSHKIYGPKGIALLCIKKGTNITPLLHGGGHESNLRSSTVNLPLISAFAKTIALRHSEHSEESQRLFQLRHHLITNILKKIPNSYLNGHPKSVLPNIVSFRFDNVEGESILLKLDQLEIAVSTGSACSSNNLKPSHVLLACGLKAPQTHGSIRVSFGRWTTKKEINYLIKVLPKIIKHLRSLSPF
ncbi:cysteine desulfurase [Patescibacteria group bacterium]|nr:cysteine desulfurase [Patescibacteria group bacterium]